MHKTLVAIGVDSFVSPCHCIFMLLHAPILIEVDGPTGTATSNSMACHAHTGTCNIQPLHVQSSKRNNSLAIQTTGSSTRLIHKSPRKHKPNIFYSCIWQTTRSGCRINCLLSCDLVYMHSLTHSLSHSLTPSFSQSVSQSVSQAGRQSGSQAVRQSGSQAVRQSGSQSVNQSISQSILKY